MPELPEVETTRLGVIGYAKGESLLSMDSSQKKLRYPCDFKKGDFIGSPCLDINRRAKYLIFNFGKEKLLMHLGMSGSLRVEITSRIKKKKHDHCMLHFTGGHSLIYHDPRRFGFIVRHSGAWREKMAAWGPEPLSVDFCKKQLLKKVNQSTRAIKQLIMDQSVVVGVGNIYASEVLFKLGIHPMKKGCTISEDEASGLVKEIKNTLHKSIEQGGTTLRDFISGKEKPGYFKQSLMVYGREGELCFECDTAIERLVLAQRSSFYCPKCQPFSVSD
ncbi:MAG: bifunctional DNA-formamidopyrimidine glycosylase/DNA-(apurinic or apyrimidinic site) lyase [Gammaproteobacteria bacterium]|nr:bifunctional DNA-formamidopyrimidine glycosylase/DNA-(apurinic or apyrimidinic site) lyase [Gammaproteobacteria bacterium]